MQKKYLKFNFYLIFFFALSIQAQVSFEGVPDYGKIKNIIFDEEINNKLYALTKGNHILTSKDKGHTWEVLYSYPENEVVLYDLKYVTEINGLSFSVRNSEIKNNVYLIDTETGELIREYHLPNYPDLIDDEVPAYAIYKGNIDIIAVYRKFTLTNENTIGNIYYSTDGGVNWDIIYTSDDYDGLLPSNVKINPLLSSMIYVPTFGGLYLSQNSGESWTVVLEDIPVKVMTFNPNDASQILMGTAYTTAYSAYEQKLYISSNDGLDWFEIPISWIEDSTNSVAAITYNPLNTYEVIVLDENEIVHTNNLFLSTTQYVFPTHTTENYYKGKHLSFNPFQSGEVIINTDHYPMISENSLETLEFMKMPFYNVLQVRVFNSQNSKHLYYSVPDYQGIIHKNLITDDVQMHQIQDYYNYDVYLNRLYYANPYLEGQLVTYKMDWIISQFALSNNHGANFTTFMSLADLINDLKFNPHNPNQAWASLMINGVIVFNFTDPGNITFIPIVVPDRQIVTSILFNPEIPNQVIITDGTKVKKSNNSGLHWEEISNGIELNPTDILYDISSNPFNPSQMITTSNIDMYMTLDGGENWEVVYEGKVRETRFSNISDGQIVGSIYSFGSETAQLIYSTDGGLSWTEIPREAVDFVNSYSMDYLFTENAVTVYMATNDLGPVSYEINLTSLSTPSLPNRTNNLVVYPNPAKDIVRFSLESENAKTISIYSSKGKMVMQKAYKESIDISTLNSGIYFIKITTECNHHLLSKLIKN
jgi:xyloglucan-specific exo-beta-1,4-glucanase